MEIIAAIIIAVASIVAVIVGHVLINRQKSSKKNRSKEKVSMSSSTSSKALPSNRILIIGQTCWDEIWVGSRKKDERIGGSAYYVKQAVKYIANHMGSHVFIDVLAPFGSDKTNEIRPQFDGTGISIYPLPTGQTLSFKNIYTNEHESELRSQQVLTMPSLRIGSKDIKSEILEKLKRDKYRAVLLLTLTPYDFIDISADMIPFLRNQNPKVKIGVELQGLTRNVPMNGGSVSKRVSDDISSLLKQRISCSHCTIEEGADILRDLHKRRGTPLPTYDLDPCEIAWRLCEFGISYVGVTNGGSGASIAWHGSEGNPLKQHIPTSDISDVALASNTTGSGDTWFGIFAYALFNLRLPPVASGALANLFATFKCMNIGALGE